MPIIEIFNIDVDELLSVLWAKSLSILSFNKDSTEPNNPSVMLLAADLLISPETSHAFIPVLTSSILISSS